MKKKLFLLLYIQFSLFSSACTCVTYAKPGLNNMSNNKSQSIPIVHNKLALVVGFTEYQDEKLPNMDFIRVYAEDFSHKLTTLNENSFASQNIKTILGYSASWQNLNNECLTGMVGKKALPDDLVLIYLSGLAKLTNDNIYFYCFDSVYDPINNGMNDKLLNIKDLMVKFKNRSGSKYIVLAVDIYNCPYSQIEPILAKLSDDLKITTIIYSHGKASSNNDPLNKQNDPNNGNLAGCKTNVVNNDKNPKSSPNNSKPDTITINLEANDENNTLYPNLASYLMHLFSTGVYSFKDLLQDKNLHICTGDNLISEISFNCPITARPKDTKINYGFSLTDIYIKRPDIALISQINSGSKSSDNKDDDDNEVSKDEMDVFMVNMKKKINQTWKIPKSLNSIRVITGFTVLKDGKIVDPSILQSSGDKNIDDSALQALKDASPLDKLPEQAPEFLQIRYTFKWDVK